MHIPKFLKVNPILPCQDMTQSIAFWQKLGFTNIFDSINYGEEPVNYAVLRRDGLCVHLQHFDEIEKQYSPQIRFEVQAVDALWEEFKAVGILDGSTVLRTTPWNTREFGIFDPNKTGITFFEAINSQ